MEIRRVSCLTRSSIDLIEVMVKYMAISNMLKLLATASDTKRKRLLYYYCGSQTEEEQTEKEKGAEIFTKCRFFQLLTIFSRGEGGIKFTVYV